MRIIILLLVFTCLGAKAQKSCPFPIELEKDSYVLDKDDLFIITEYKETQYQSFLDRDSLNLPANLSSENYYVDINGETDSSNLIDINYLYLQGYHNQKQTYGELFYLLSRKNIPIGKRNIPLRSKNSVELYSELSSIIDMSFGYWQLDPITHRIFIIFRDRTKIWNMNNFRVFVGLVLNKNIYLTKAMNTKDAYLFEDNFIQTKEIIVKLPISLESVLHSQKIKTSDTTEILASMLPMQSIERINNGNNQKLKTIMDNWSKTGNGDSSQQLIPQVKTTELVTDQGNDKFSRKTKDTTFNATIKYSYYPTNRANLDNRKIEYLNYEQLSFTFLKKRNGKRASKYVLFKGKKGNLYTYSKVNIKQYKKYYWESNQKEFIYIYIVDPYDERIRQTFKIPYSGAKGDISRVTNFIRKKILSP